MANYRPISLLCCVSKLLERIIYNKVINYISNRISLTQYGFMNDRSTLQQLLVFLNCIHENSKDQVDIIYLDFAKAFDQAPHNQFLLKLCMWSIGITNDLWLWFRSYLYKRYQQWRSQSFKVGRAQSEPLTALIGYLNVLLEYLNFSNFHWQGTTNIWVGLGPTWPALGYAPGYQCVRINNSCSDYLPVLSGVP